MGTGVHPSPTVAGARAVRVGGSGLFWAVMVENLLCVKIP